MKLTRVALWVAALAAGGAQGQRHALYAHDVTREISSSGMRTHLARFLDAAALDKGVRRMGGLGYQGSVNWAAQGLKRCRNSRQHQVLPFTFPLETVQRLELWVDSFFVPKVTAARYNTNVKWSANTRKRLGEIPVDDVDGSGCLERQWKNATSVAGRIVLVKGGGCPVVDKVKLAKRYGALAVILYDTHPTPSLGRDSVNRLIPVVVVGDTAAKRMKRQLEVGDVVRVKLRLKTKFVERQGQNVIGETKVGNPDSVVLLGARLDSHHGPGVNDNGSGVAAILEMFRRITRKQYHQRSIRVAFWGGEYGAAEYLAGLNRTEQAKIKVYIDVNTVGTRHPNWTVFSHNEADMFAAQFLVNFLEEKGIKNATLRAPGPESDSEPFRRLGIPCTGITTGPDACKDMACDGMKNVDFKVLRRATQTALYATVRLAKPGRKRTKKKERNDYWVERHLLGKEVRRVEAKRRREARRKRKRQRKARKTRERKERKQAQEVERVRIEKSKVEKKFKEEEEKKKAPEQRKKEAEERRRAQAEERRREEEETERKKKEKKRIEEQMMIEEGKQNRDGRRMEEEEKKNVEG